MSTRRILKTAKTALQSFLQRIIISFDLFNKNELLNHAGATCFFFLLSVAPVLILLMLVFQRLVSFYPGFSDGFFSLLSRFNPSITREALSRIGLLSRRGVAVDIIGVLSMFWFSRLILLGIQRGIGIIFPADRQRSAIMQNVIAVASLPILILMVTVIVFVSIGLDVSATLTLDDLSSNAFLSGLLSFLGDMLPFAALLLLIFLAYKLIPVVRPKAAPALLGSSLCTAGVAIVQVVFRKAIDAARFDLLYGILGSLILALLGTYIVFQLFFIFAQFVYVTDRLDLLTLERMLLFRGKKTGRIGRYLFRRPERFLRKYARPCSEGEVLFRRGDGGREIFFIYEGRIGISLEAGKRIAVIDEGEIFGEMAYLLEEPRTATATIEKPSILVVLTPQLFEGLLKINEALSRKVIDLLCSRLRESHRYAVL